ncbi:MAG: methyl-accepting chemotaxis protein [Acidobacteriota bacterium]|nr:methyl-accepting chemotaxis protein [Acidobacteriota bacterium]
MRFTLGRKIWALSLTVFFFVGAACLCVYWQMNDALKWQEMIIGVKWPSAQVFSDTQTTMNLSRMVLRDIVLDYGDNGKQQKDIERYQKINTDLEATLQKMGELSKEFLKEENKQRVKAILEGVPAARQYELAAIEQAKQGKQKEALATLRNALTTVNAVRDNLNELQNQNNTLTGNIFQSIQNDMNNSILWLAGCFVAVLVMGCAVSWRVARAVSVNAQTLCQRAEDIANGDLTGAELTTAGQDEFSDLAASMSRMQQHLRGILLKVREASGDLSETSEKISESSNHTAEAARQQTDHTNTVASAIHEMTATVNQVSDHSHTAADTAASAAATAKEGGQVVRETMEVMQRIAQSNERIAERVTKLGDSSQQVGKIAAVIDDIADQTNLLALNAAIEAARAGEQGRGFAVVADEVRKLAERTTSATKEIAQILSVVLEESQNTASAVSEGQKDVDAGLRGARQAGDALERIIEMATKVGDMVSQIATAARQQSTATEEIQSSAQRIAGMASDSSSAASQSAAACEQLSALALRLQEIVQVFRIGQENSTPASWSTHNPHTQLPNPSPMASMY